MWAFGMIVLGLILLYAAFSGNALQVMAALLGRPIAQTPPPAPPLPPISGG